MRLGTLVPHFGRFASRDGIVQQSRRSEELGFDSLWVRDHLIWEPHGIEGTDKTFIDPFETLAAAAAVTERIALGTAVVIPVRWPLKLAQEFAGLSFLSGGRVIAGIGLGFNPKEFAAVGFRAEDREAIFHETVEILRAAWGHGRMSYRGVLFEADDVELLPKPCTPIPLYYGGSTPAAVRRAARETDGWYCGRLPLATLDARLALLRTMAPQVATRTVVQPLVVVAKSRNEAVEHLPLDLLLGSSEGSRFWVKPESGEFRTLDDLEGLVLFGSPEDIVRQAKVLQARGISELVFDLRLQFDHYATTLELLSREVLPELRTEPTSSDTSTSATSSDVLPGPPLEER